MISVKSDSTLSLLINTAPSDVATTIFCLLEQAIDRVEKERILCYARSLDVSFARVLLCTFQSRNLGIAITCLLQKPDLNSRIGEMYLIEWCCMYGAYELLDLIIKGGASLASDFNICPIMICLQKKHIECIKVLLNHNYCPLKSISCEEFFRIICLPTCSEHCHSPGCKSVTFGLYNDSEAHFDVLMQLISFYSTTPNLLDTIKLATTKVPKIDLRHAILIDRHVLDGDTKLAEILVEVYPECLNILIFEDHTILTSLIKSGNNELVIDCIMKLDTDLTIVSYMEDVIINTSLECIYILADVLDEKYWNKAGVLDKLLNNNKLITEEYILDVIQIFADKGFDFNAANDDGVRPIELAIRSHSPNIVSEILRYTNIRTPAKIKNADVVLISNSDTLAYATQMGNIQTIQLLLEDKVYINYWKKIPTCILAAIRYNQKEALKYLLTVPTIRSQCTKKNTQILDFIINTYSSNSDLLGILNPGYVIPKQTRGSIEMTVNNIVKLFIDRVGEDEYEVNKQIFIDSHKRILELFINISKVRRDAKYARCAIEWQEMMDQFLQPETYDMIIQFCIRTFSGHISYSEFNHAFRALGDITRDTSPYRLLECIEHLKQFKKLLTPKRLKDIKLLISRLAVKSESPTKKINYGLHEKKDERSIKQLLINLRYPVKQPHYDYVYQKLQGTDCIVEKKDNALSVMDTETCTTATIYKPEGGNDLLTKPKKWFTSYSFNIGLQKKRDIGHSFPFHIDELLAKEYCYVAYEKDKHSTTGTSSMYYFCGEIVCRGKIQRGIYEYFVDSHGVLFHRFFRPITKVPGKFKKIFNLD